VQRCSQSLGFMNYALATKRLKAALVPMLQIAS